MKKFTLLFLYFALTASLNAQTIAWSSDSEDLTGWSIFDNDGDTNNWGVYSGGGESIGFSPGALFFSESWNSTVGPLNPDNFLFTPVFAISGTAVSISFKMKVAAAFTPDYAENFAVYIYDNDDLNVPDVLIYEETLSSGGDGTAKDITATIPVSFAGKNVGLLIRHYNCTNQFQLLVDDFEVSYTTSLSTEDEDNELIVARVFPNPVNDIISIETKENIDGISILNQLGQQVLKFNKSQIFNNRVDLSALTKGFYFMTINAENKSQSIKIIKE
ncbi:T9SS type A sorting domain-containing protein [Mariniflexile sp. HNIBRBA6329]|uniref:T9SS type A sorting domain-containing protein n=1 Tax=Mariniflexile sp. HNIBRBA6329 TaxID=3373088 RepID=UPI0037458FD0